MSVTGLRTWNGLDELREAPLVFVSYNPQLADIGLPALESVEVLYVFENAALEILGFEGLSGPADVVWIHDNRVLPTCEAAGSCD